MKDSKNSKSFFFSINKKELLQLSVLIILLLIGTMFFFSFGWKSAPLHPEDMPSDWETLRSTPLTNLPKFEESHEVLSKIKDDEYLEVEGFFYFLRQICSIKEKELAAKHNPSFTWENLKKLKDRSQYRGQVTKIRGCVVDLKRKELFGKLAEENGIKGMSYWQCAIFDENSHLYIVILDKFPEDIRPYQMVNFYGIFYKVWYYKSQANHQANSPVLLGKTFNKIKLASPTEIYKISWTTVIFFAILAVIIMMEVAEYSQPTFIKKNFRQKKTQLQPKETMSTPILPKQSESSQD